MAGLDYEDSLFLMRAIHLADAAVVRGDHPFGAVIVARPVPLSAEAADLPRPRIVVAAMNSVNTGCDPTGHAETNAIRQLGAFLAKAKRGDLTDEAMKGSDRIDAVHHDNRDIFPAASSQHSSAFKVQYELFTSTEPCIMCCGAIYWSFTIDRVVYACPEVGLAKHAGDDFLCPCRETLAKGKGRNVSVEGPFLAAEAEKAHASYWPKLFGTAEDSKKPTDEAN